MTSLGGTSNYTLLLSTPNLTRNTIFHRQRANPGHPSASVTNPPILPSTRSIDAFFRLHPVNTAKLSSPILLQRTVSYDAANKPPRRGSIYLNMPERNTGGEGAAGARRRRSSSILQVYHEPPETLEQISDQASLPNLNANWTNAKGMSTLSLCKCTSLLARATC